MNRLLSLIATCLLLSGTFAQNNPPVAVQDKADTYTQTPIVIDVLGNDYDPDGDSISISWINLSTYKADIDTANNLIICSPHNIIGNDYFEYQITDHDSPPLTSDRTKVLLSISLHPDAPLATPDTLQILEIVPVEVNILQNDFDPNGDELIIDNISSTSHCDIILNEDSTLVTIIPYDGASAPQTASFYYTVIEKNTTEAYQSERVKVSIDILQNPDLPVALDDSASTTGGVEVVIPVLSNDYDPQGESVEIDRFWGSNGQVTLKDDSLVYTPNICFTGTSRLSYTIREINDTVIHSYRGYVYVDVAKNSDCPVGEPDYASGITFQQINIEVLSNDHGTIIDALEIYKTETTGTAVINGNYIEYTSWPFTMDHDTLYYKIRHVLHNNYYSEWVPVYIELATNPELPIANNDSAYVQSCRKINIYPLVNDIANAADTLVVLGATSVFSKGRAEVFSDNIVRYSAGYNSKGEDIIRYTISDKQDHHIIGQGYIYVTIEDSHFYDSLTINNINAGVNGDGFLFSNIFTLPIERDGYIAPHFRYPNGSKTNTIFSHTFWLGGISDQDSLHFAGERYRQIGVDFQPGPISNTYDSSFAQQFWKVWNIQKDDIEYHRNNWWKTGYQPIEEIATWPGNGDPEKGQAEQLAPFSDFNEDGLYNPLNGDYPLIRGDQCVFFICNDDKEHTESEGKRFKVEVQGMVYGFNTPDDSALWNTVFVHYDLINRSEKNFYDVYAAFFTDFDNGYPWDDHVGSEVSRSSYYVYNGLEYDDVESSPTYEDTIWGYGQFPPAQSVTVLAGPFMDPDGEDNPSGGCDYSVNGTNFGNGINDDERLGLCRFVYANMNSNWGEPYYAPQYYKLMNGYWSYDLPWQYGGSMGYQDPDAVGPRCNFMFPGDSDLKNWGTDCIPPNEGYNQGGKYWTDSSTFIPFDRRGLGIMGPFTFESGQVQEIDLAFVAANGWNGAQSSVDKLMEYIDTLRARVNKGEIIIPNESLGIEKQYLSHNKINIFPNPAEEFINIEFPGSSYNDSEYAIYNLMGKTVDRGRLGASTISTVQTGNLKSGFYVIAVRSKKITYTSKFIKCGK